MYKLLQSEWLIWSKSTIVVWSVVLALIALLLFPLAATQTPRFETIIQDCFSFPTVWVTCSFINLLPIQLMSFLVIFIACRSIDDRTYRMHLLGGETRTQLFQRRVIFLFVLSLLSVMVTFIAGWLCGYLIDPNGYFMASPLTIKSLAAFAIQAMFYLMCALAIGMLVRKILLAFIIYFMWFSFIERLLAHFLEKIGVSIFFFPGRVIESLSVFDADAIIQKTPLLYDYTFLGAALVWFTLVSLLTFNLFQKSRF